MMRRLLIMRHAKSDWDTAAESDFDRPLSKRGKRDAPRMGRWLLGQKLVPDWTISSPALRAKQTVVKVCRELGLKKKAVNWEPEIYGAELKQLLAILARCPQDKRLTLLVGHNPGVEELLEYLAKGTGTLPVTEKLLPTAAIAYLWLPDDWSALEEGAGRVETIMHPKALPGA